MLVLAGASQAIASQSADERYAALEKKYLSDILCRDQVMERINGSGGEGTEFRTSRQWTREAGGNDGSVVLMSPTTLAGLWTHVKVFQNKEVEISYVTAKLTRTYVQDLESGCSFTSKVARRPKAEPGFTDHDLAALVKAGGYGVVYVWSPNMPYGFKTQQQVQAQQQQQQQAAQEGDNDTMLTGLVEVNQAVAELAADLGKPVKVSYTVDPTAKQGAIVEALKVMPKVFQDKQDELLRPVRAVDIIFRSAGDHYPSLLVYANGEIARLVYPGVGTVAEYKKQILTMIKGIEARQEAK